MSDVGTLFHVNEATSLVLRPSVELATGLWFPLSEATSLALQPSVLLATATWFELNATASLGWLALIYVFAGIVSGFSGFGFSAIGALSLIYLPPTLAISLLMMLSLGTQAMSSISLRHEMQEHFRPWYRADGVIPYCVGGTLGMPMGIQIMLLAGTKALMFVLGLTLVAYSAYSLWKPDKLQIRSAGSWRSSVLVGACGGVVGGFSAFPGSVIVIWNSLKGVPKEKGRALTQPFILFMQLVGLALIWATQPEVFSGEFWTLFSIMLPLALLGSVAGIAIYRKTSQLNYRSFTFALLGLSGLGLLAKSAISPS